MAKYILKSPNGPAPIPKRSFIPWETLPDTMRLEALEIIGKPDGSDYSKAKELYEWAARIGSAPFQTPKTYREWSTLAGFKWNPLKSRQSNKMTEMWAIKRLQRIKMEANRAFRTGKKPDNGGKRQIDRRILPPASQDPQRNPSKAPE